MKHWTMQFVFARTLAVIFIFALSMSVGYSADREVHVFPRTGQEKILQRGREVVVSRGACTVMVEPSPYKEKRLWLSIMYINATPLQQTMYAERISAQSQGKSLRIFLADDILKAEKRSHMWEDIGVGLVAGLNSYAAGQQGQYTESGTVSGEVQDGARNYGFRGSYVASGFDPSVNASAVREANATNGRMIAELEAQQQLELESLDDALLYSQTLGAGETLGGRVQVEIPRRERRKAQSFELSVEACGSSHLFEMFLDGPAPEATPYVESPVRKESENVQGSLATPSYSADHDSTSSFSPTITRISIESQETENGGAEDVVFFDVTWDVTGAKGDVSGKLEMLDVSGVVHVSMPWTISATNGKMGRFVEAGVGFPASEFGDKLTWLRQVHLPAITARFRVDSGNSTEVASDVSNSEEVATEAKVLRSELVLIENPYSDNPVFKRTRVVPRVVGQVYAWMMELSPKVGKVWLKEEMTLPKPPNTWGDIPKGMTRRISANGLTVVIEGYVDVDDGMIGQTWEIADGDPIGSYVLRLTVNKEPPEVFEFQVQ